LGLIGGSAGLAWRAAGHTVVGYARRADTRHHARALGAADETPELLAGAARADVVVLAAPVLAIRQLLIDLAPHLAPGAIVSDAASTKLAVERWARRFLPPHVHFVGGHPMAGKEAAGIDHADGALFRGRTWCIVPPAGADEQAVEVVTRLAADTGAKPLRIGAAEHDRAVAATSHLPFMAAAALCLSVVAQPRFAAIAAVAGTGLRDTTRLASGDPRMHRDICLTNRDNLLVELEQLSARLAEAADLLRQLPEPDIADDQAALGHLEALFVRLKQARDAWLER
jgi:prephenate dehydrogenase